MVVIIDYGTGNSGSILNMLRKVGAKGVISNDPEIISQAHALILPGVGAFDNAMRKFNESGLRNLVEIEVLIKKKPFLGVCLGMQLLFDKSEEGQEKGLSWIPGTVEKFDYEKRDLPKQKVPHMGWNVVTPENESILFDNSESELRFYFVHTYHVVCDSKYVIGTSKYGYKFVCAVQKDNILATQFHPEKSHKFGMQLFKNFVNSIC